MGSSIFTRPLISTESSAAIFVEGPDVLEDVGHLVDGVVATLRGGAVAGHTVHVHTDLHAATVTTVDAAVGGLGGNDELHLAAGILMVR